jgi:hypothetical protein
MDGYFIYKKYLYYLISQNRNTRKNITYKKIYTTSPLSKCQNAEDIYKSYTLNLLKEFILISDDGFNPYINK